MPISAGTAGMFASSSGGGGNARPTTMIRIWVVAAVALVAGILIGFASGFTAGTRVGEPGIVASPAPAASDPSATSTQTFSEEAVKEPVRVEPEPVVPERAALPALPALPALSERAARVEGSEPKGRVDWPGSIQVVSRPSGAQVILDGRSVGRTPLLLAEVSNGAHDIRLDLPGFRRWATAVQVTPGQRTRVAASLEQ